MPLITIITPLYNCVDSFTKTYNSVISQNFRDWEWIIIDDCSIDGSFELAKKLSSSEKRVVIMQTDVNSGTACARNIGLKKAEGKYVTFLDSDDLLDSNYLENQLQFMETNGPIISAGYRRKAEHTCTDFYVPDFVDYKTALRGNPLSCLTTMYNREIIKDVFFPENIEKPEDYVFWLNILKQGYVARGNKKILATYVIRSGSKSSNKFKLIKHMYRVYHETQKFNFFKSVYFVIRWAFYGKKKYKNVR